MHKMHVACRIRVHHHASFSSFFFFSHSTSIKWFVSWTVGNRLLKPLCGKMLDWLNFRLREILGLIHVHALEKEYHQNKTLLRYNFGSVYHCTEEKIDNVLTHSRIFVYMYIKILSYWNKNKNFTFHYMSPVKRICVFEHSVMTNFNCACPAIQRGQGSGFLSEGSSWLTACMSEQRRFWRDCADAQARLNLRCSHRR